ncbi:phage tail protein [Bacillus horti]
MGSFRFFVELGGVFTAGFSEVTGLQTEQELHQYYEGGLNEYPHQFPKRMKYSNLVLKRGISHSTLLWEWYMSVQPGQSFRRDGAIILVDRSGMEICRWNFTGAYPIKWSGPDLNATRNEIGIESIELVHTGLKAIYTKLI